MNATIDANSIKVVNGCTTPETAHLSFAYPYGRHRCIRREWVERKGNNKVQFRFVTQTTDSRFNATYTERLNRDGADAANEWARAEIEAQRVHWNAPKPSTYAQIVVMVENPLNDGTGRVGVDYLSYSALSGPERLMRIRNSTAGQLDAEQNALLNAFEALDRKVNRTSWQRYEESQTSTTLAERALADAVSGAQALREPIS